MKDLSVPPFSSSSLENNRDDREAILTALSTAAGSIPFYPKAMKVACDNVKELGGMELVVEACATIGAFEAITKLVDATGKTLHSKREDKVHFAVVRCIQQRYAIGAALAAIVAAAVASSVLRSAR